jgi:hypothetical protein
VTISRTILFDFVVVFQRRPRVTPGS